MAAKVNNQCDTCTLEERVDALEEAFPDGPIRHRDAHIAWMDSKRAEAAFWKDLRDDVIKKGVWGIIVIICGLIIIGAMVKLGIQVKP